ncbi:hypothetical protein GPECTOR_1g758 [Gonium pectorale]|uniref:Uncharacterized protein n=1 Tax=Gonium pectorale TaxID=33097 RepID=A0A150H5E2_GONPE|nr:hypothetical protein GPECTOR_1g758 [Gonium pectorale]|eukprot:KXZ56840.1 hypothetical protein GPECTOR_1g758 [Gonium pectorale]
MKKLPAESLVKDDSRGDRQFTDVLVNGTDPGGGAAAGLRSGADEGGLSSLLADVPLRHASLVVPALAELVTWCDDPGLSADLRRLCAALCTSPAPGQAAIAGAAAEGPGGFLSEAFMHRCLVVMEELAARAQEQVQQHPPPHAAPPLPSALLQLMSDLAAAHGGAAAVLARGLAASPLLLSCLAGAIGRTVADPQQPQHMQQGGVGNFPVCVSSADRLLALRLVLCAMEQPCDESGALVASAGQQLFAGCCMLLGASVGPTHGSAEQRALCLDLLAALVTRGCLLEQAHGLGGLDLPASARLTAQLAAGLKPCLLDSSRPAVQCAAARLLGAVAARSHPRLVAQLLEADLAEYLFELLRSAAAAMAGATSGLGAAGAEGGGGSRTAAAGAAAADLTRLAVIALSHLAIEGPAFQRRLPFGVEVLAELCAAAAACADYGLAADVAPLLRLAVQPQPYNCRDAEGDHGGGVEGGGLAAPRMPLADLQRIVAALWEQWLLPAVDRWYGAVSRSGAESPLALLSAVSAAVQPAALLMASALRQGLAHAGGDTDGFAAAASRALAGRLLAAGWVQFSFDVMSAASVGGDDDAGGGDGGSTLAASVQLWRLLLLVAAASAQAPGDYGEEPAAAVELVADDAAAGAASLMGGFGSVGAALAFMATGGAHQVAAAGEGAAGVSAAAGAALALFLRLLRCALAAGDAGWAAAGGAGLDWLLSALAQVLVEPGVQRCWPVVWWQCLHLYREAEGRLAQEAGAPMLPAMLLPALEDMMVAAPGGGGGGDAHRHHHHHHQPGMAYAAAMQEQGAAAGGVAAAVSDLGLPLAAWTLQHGDQLPGVIAAALPVWLGGAGSTGYGDESASGAVEPPPGQVYATAAGVACSAAAIRAATRLLQSCAESSSACGADSGGGRRGALLRVRLLQLLCACLELRPDAAGGAVEAGLLGATRRLVLDLATPAGNGNPWAATSMIWTLRLHGRVLGAVVDATADASAGAAAAGLHPGNAAEALAAADLSLGSNLPAVAALAESEAVQACCLEAVGLAASAQGANEDSNSSIPPAPPLLASTSAPALLGLSLMVWPPHSSSPARLDRVLPWGRHVLRSVLAGVCGAHGLGPAAAMHFQADPAAEAARAKLLAGVHALPALAFLRSVVAAAGLDADTATARAAAGGPGADGGRARGVAGGSGGAATAAEPHLGWVAPELRSAAAENVLVQALLAPPAAWLQPLANACLAGLLHVGALDDSTLGRARSAVAGRLWRSQQGAAAGGGGLIGEEDVSSLSGPAVLQALMQHAHDVEAAAAALGVSRL